MEVYISKNKHGYAHICGALKTTSGIDGRSNIKSILIWEINYEKLIGQWHRDRNLIDGSSDKDQYMKLIQEAGELSDSLCKGKDIKDDIGDMMVVLINIMVRNNLTMNECLSVAYNDIKDRKGKMVDGVFVKEGDT